MLPRDRGLAAEAPALNPKTSGPAGPTTMDHFRYRDGRLYCEDVPVADLAGRYGTPLYVYSQGVFLDRLKALQSAFAEVDPLICYSVKANSNLGVLKMLAGHGSGFDVVSGGELRRVV